MVTLTFYLKAQFALRAVIGIATADETTRSTLMLLGMHQPHIAGEPALLPFGK